MKNIQYIEQSNIYKKQVNILNDKHINYKKTHGDNWISLSTPHHNYLFYTSNKNRQHIFFCRVFNKDKIQSSLIGKGSRNITKCTYDTDIKVHRDEKIITYRNTDIGNTTNVNRIETTQETFGYPFKRKISYGMILGSKDRLQYKKECIELHIYDRNGNRKKIIDNVFATRVYRLFLRFKGYSMNDIKHILLSEKYISAKLLVAIMQYLYQVMNSYNPFFYKENGLSKYNKYWIKETIHRIVNEADMYSNIQFSKVNRSKNIDSRIIKPKDVLDWRKQRQRLLDKGELWEDIE